MNNTTNETEYPNNAERKAIEDVAAQLEMAFNSDETPEAVKDCLKTIIIEAATNAHKPSPDFDYIDHVRAVLPDIISSLGKGYGAGVLRSIQAILLYDTKVFVEFHGKKEENKTTVPEERKVYKFKYPLVSEETFITRDEAEKFIKSVMQDTSCEDYVLEGFIFMFQSFSEMANQAQVELQDLCDGLCRLVYQETLHETLILRKFVESSHKRYRETDWYYETSNYAENIEKEVHGNDETPNVLDLSEHPAECQSLNKLAVQISEVMQNPLLPKDIYNVLADELNEVPNQADSPEWIAANLKIKAEK